MTDETEDLKWPREIWAAERGEFDPTGTYVLSEHATIARFEGDQERDREFHHYVDADILQSTERHYRAQLESERDRAARLDAALRNKDAAMQVLFSRLKENGIDTSDLIP